MERSLSRNRRLVHSLDDLRDLHLMCQRGQLFGVQEWIAEGKPLQLAPEAIRKATRPRTALQIALQSGQHSLSLLLLRSGYRLELERYAFLDLVLEARRWDLFDLLLEWGADLMSVDVYTVLDTYNVDLYERFRAAGYDLTERHEMGSYLGHSTSNRPLLGFMRRYRGKDPKIQQELNIALGYHAKAGNEKGVKLCLWAGADPHAPAPNLELAVGNDTEPDEDEEDSFVGWSAIEEAASAGHLDILKRFKPDPNLDDFDSLYGSAGNVSIIEFLRTIQPPKDLTSMLSIHVMPWRGGAVTGTVEALLNCGVQWSENDAERLADIRRSLLKLDDYDLKRILSRLRQPEVCAPETYQALTRTKRMQERLLSMGLVKKPISKREARRNELDRLMKRYDRELLYKHVWSQPVQQVAETYGISGVALGKACRKLRVPVPPRGYWSRARSGVRMKRPPLPKLEGRRAKGRY